MIIDSHCHFDFDVFDNNRDTVIQRAARAGVEKIIIPGVKASGWQKIKTICAQYESCLPAYGLHPYFIEEHQQQHLDELDHWLATEHCIGVGECGLDFYLKNLDKNKQIDFFEAQLSLADKYQLPVIIHARKSTEQVIQCLRQYKNLRGMIHSFSGSYEQANQLIDRGFYLSFGGAITYDRASRLHEMVKKLPLESLLIETDAPDQPGQSHYQEINEPAYITEVINKLTVLSGHSYESIAKITTDNAINLFSLNVN